jgi:hypothetical protein
MRWYPISQQLLRRILWNTVYLEQITHDLSDGQPLDDTLFQYLSPLVVQKTPETLVDKGLSTRQRISDFSTIRTKAMSFSRNFGRLGCPP